MKPVPDRRWIELLFRYIVGVTFMYASFHKIAAPAEFAKILYGYGLFPHMSINLIAILLPFLELVTGMALVLGLYPRAAATLITAMLLVFIAAISINMARGYTFDCGCFSFHSEDTLLPTRSLLIRDSVLLLLCIYLLRFKGIRRWSFMT